MSGITATMRKMLLKGEDTTKVSKVAGAEYSPYVYSKPVYSDENTALRDVRDKRGNHVRQEYLNGIWEEDRIVHFEEFSTPAGAEGGMLDKWGIKSDLFITQRTKGYLAYIDESRTWARWFDWPDGFPLGAYRNERFSWSLVGEDSDGLLDDVHEETNPCVHESFKNKLGFCDDCGLWILDAQSEPRRKIHDPLLRALR